MGIQLTNPPPWILLRLGAGKKISERTVKLFKQKKIEAKKFLSAGKENRAYTEEQLELEIWCRWNSGTYHDNKNNRWIRHPNILNDTNTGNIGWDVTKSENKGKTEETLHERDKAEYLEPAKRKSFVALLRSGIVPTTSKTNSLSILAIFVAALLSSTALANELILKSPSGSVSVVSEDGVVSARDETGHERITSCRSHFHVI